MKINSSILALTFIILISGSCKKKDKISYPYSDFYGENILFFPDNRIMQTNTEYDVAAELGEKSHLTIRITNLSKLTSGGFFPDWDADDIWNHGWKVSDYDIATDSQTFTSKESGKITAKISFYTTGGKCKVE